MGLSTEALAKLAGLAEVTLSRFEAGLTKPHPGTLIALRRGFHTLEQAEKGRLPEPGGLSSGVSRRFEAQIPRRATDLRRRRSE